MRCAYLSAAKHNPPAMRQVLQIGYGQSTTYLELTKCANTPTPPTLRDGIEPMLNSDVATANTILRDYKGDDSPCPETQRPARKS
jgi:hypothetical protein